MSYAKANQIQVNSEILNLIAELDEFKGRWTATQALAPDRLASLRQIATIESVGSSTRIEGVKLTNSEIEALLNGVKVYSFRSRDEQEVAGYAELMELIFGSYTHITLTENHIKQLHSALLKYSTKDERHRGEYKKFSNQVEAFDSAGKSKGIIFKTTSPFDTQKEMTELVSWTAHQLETKELHPLLTIAIFAVIFLKIHPFQDGNGRLSRALSTLLLLRSGYTYVPYSSLERVIEQNKPGYYLSLRKAQAEIEAPKRATKKSESGVTSWLVYFLKAMREQKRSLERKLKDELVIATLPPLSLEILSLIRSRGPTSIAELLAVTGANRNTLKAHCRRLVSDQHLVMMGVGRGVRYRIPSS